MEKVKVSREVAEDLDYLLKTRNKEDLMELYLNVRKEKLCYLSPSEITLRGLKPYQLAEILVKGYEIEQTPEEWILTKYQENLEKARTTQSAKEQFLMNGFNSGIRFVLYNLDIKIKGIND